MKVVDDLFPQNDGKILVTCIGISSGIGRLIAGPISDCKQVNRIIMQQVYEIIIYEVLMFLKYTLAYNLFLQSF